MIRCYTGQVQYGIQPPVLLGLLKNLEGLSILSNRLAFAQIGHVAQRVKQYEQLEQLIYIYGLECLYKTFVLHSNSFLEYYSLFIDSCKMYSSDLYFISVFLPEVPSQYTPLNIILLYFIFEAPCSHFIQERIYPQLY